jgi:uncharacterized RDD family membrane protein YckC
MADPNVRRKLDARDVPGLRRKETGWKDEVRERVRHRRRKRADAGDLPLFDAPATAEPAVSPGFVAEEPAPEAAPRSTLGGEAPSDWVDDSSEESFGSEEPSRSDAEDELADLPLRAEEPAPVPAVEAKIDVTETRRRRHVVDDEPALAAAASPAVDWSLGPRAEPKPTPTAAAPAERPVERPAAAWERVQAATVDLVLLVALGAIVVYFAGRSAHVPIERLRPAWPYLAAYLGFLALVYAVYFTGTTGQTLGKLVFRLRVIDVGGRPPSYLRSGGRAALGTIGVLVAGLGLVPMYFDPARRALHDRVLSTRVVKS